MKSTPKPLQVALAIHDVNGNYWPYTAVTITSVCEHTSTPICFHLLHDETLSTLARDSLKKIISTYGHILEFHSVNPKNLDKLNFRHFSPASIYRLMIPEILAQHDQVIYLDSDIIFNQIDIATIQQWLEKERILHPIAAVHDDLFSCYQEQIDELKNLGLNASQYFNSGLLVLHPKMIQENLLDSFEVFAKSHPSAIHLDQDFLNLHFCGKVNLLPPEFNFQVNITQNRAFKALHVFENKVLHFTGKSKPLSGKFAPPDIYFWRYTHLIPKISTLIQVPHFYLQQIPGQSNSARLIPSIPRPQKKP